DASVDGDVEDLHGERACGRRVVDRVTGAMTGERLAQRRTGRDHVELVVALFDVADQLRLGVVFAVAVVHDGDDRAWTHDTLGRALHDLAVVQDGVELANAAFHV